MLSTGPHEQDKWVAPVMLKISPHGRKCALTGGIVLQSIVFGETPRRKSKAASEVHSEHDEEIPPRYNGVGEFLVKISEP